MHLETIRLACARFVEGATRRVGGRIRSILLYGSWARGTARPDSDVDLLVVVDRRDRDVIDALQDAALETDLQFHTYLSVKVCTQAHIDEMRRLGDPFLREIEGEGRALWTRTSKDASATA